MAVEQCPTMLCTTGNGTPALAERETNVCLSEWKEATTDFRLRPSTRMDIVMFAVLKMLRKPASTRQRLARYISAISGFMYEATFS